LTVDPADETQSIWSPDGSRIVFDSWRTGSGTLLLKSTTGSGSEDVFDASPRGKFATSWSADGKFVLYNTPSGQLQSSPENRSETGNDLWVVPLDGDRKPVLYLQTPFNETRGQFSPDGKWIAYQSNQSGRFEIYVGSFPVPGRAWQVSTTGGTSPRWRKDGHELFFVSADSKLMSAEVDGRSALFEVGNVRPLFPVRMRDQFLGIPYAVSADGQRFLINTTIDTNAPTPISLVLNWRRLLAER
jgi:Tol biopolymer transport system component